MQEFIKMILVTTFKTKKDIGCRDKFQVPAIYLHF